MSTKVKVLVGDSSEKYGATLAKALENFGFDAKTSQRCELDIINTYKEFKPDVVITDVILSDISALDLIDSLAATTSKMPVIIVLSSREMLELQMAAEAKGVELFICKPIDVDFLGSSILDQLGLEVDLHNYMLAQRIVEMIGDNKPLKRYLAQLLYPEIFESVANEKEK